MGHPAFLKFPPNINYLLFTGAYSRETLVHPTRVIQFLVGVRGKNETMAIGGPWSPSLDGADPEVSLAIDSSRQGCQIAKFDPFLSLDCARLEGRGANQGKEGIKFCSIA